MKTLLVFLLLTGTCFSDIVVDQIKGDARVRFGKKLTYSKLRKGDKLSNGDVVKTYKGGMVHLKFHDESTILIKENARFKISDSKSKTEISFSQKFGGQAEFLINVEKVLKKKQKAFNIKTPAAVVGVRGTVFWGLSDKNLNSTYACFESEISITAKGQTKILKPGKKISIPFGKAPGKIEDANIPLNYIDTFEVDGSTQDIKSKLSKK